jgi:hypothetical protein
LYDQDKLYSLVLDVNGSPIEMLNYDRIGTLQNYNKRGPVLDRLEYDVNLIKPYHNCVQYFLNHLTPFSNSSEAKRPIDLKLIQKFVYGLFGPIQKKDQKPIIGKYITHIRKHPRHNIK